MKTNSMNKAEAAPAQVAQHIKPPWRVVGGTEIWAEGGHQRICICSGSYAPAVDKMRANAAFIVRACNCHEELLQALKRLLRLWEEAIGNEPDYMDMADFARAAIAKAQGDNRE